MSWRRSTARPRQPVDRGAWPPKCRSGWQLRSLYRGDRAGRYSIACREAPLYPHPKAGAASNRALPGRNSRPMTACVLKSRSISMPADRRQAWKGDMTPSVFKRELSRARTFGFMRDVEPFGQAVSRSARHSKTRGNLGRQRGHQCGGTAVYDEFVRHKTLDAVAIFRWAGALPSSAATAPIAAGTG